MKNGAANVRFVPEADPGKVSLPVKEETCMVVKQPHQVC